MFSVYSTCHCAVLVILVLVDASRMPGYLALNELVIVIIMRDFKFCNGLGPVGSLQPMSTNLLLPSIPNSTSYGRLCPCTCPCVIVPIAPD